MISNSCNTDMRALPDLYTQLHEVCKPKGREHTYQEKPECPMLQLMYNTSNPYQADKAVKGTLYSSLIWLPMKFNLFCNLQMVLANVLYFVTGYTVS